MSTPRIEVDLRKIRHNTQTVSRRLFARGIAVSGVTKAVCGHPKIAQAMLDGGAVGLAEARLRNVKRLRKAGIKRPITLIRTPMLSQVDAVVQFCETSYNTQADVIAALSGAARRKGKVHGIILMVEMGDGRDGIMPEDLNGMVGQVMDMPGVVLKGIGANFACLNKAAPKAADMAALSDLATDIEGAYGPFLRTVSGGNSANLPWALSDHATGRINDLRLGEALLLGVDPVSGDHIAGTYQDAFTLVAEVIETDRKSAPPIVCLTNPTLSRLRLLPEINDTTRLILALGRQDTDISGLTMPLGHTLIGATSDHLVLGTTRPMSCVGSEKRFQMNYSALMHAMAAPDVAVEMREDRPFSIRPTRPDPVKHLALV